MNADVLVGLAAGLAWTAWAILSSRRHIATMREMSSQKAWSVALRWGFTASIAIAGAFLVPTVWRRLFSGEPVPESGVLLSSVLLALAPGPIIALSLYRASRSGSDGRRDNSG